MRRCSSPRSVTSNALGRYTDAPSSRVSRDDCSSRSETDLAQRQPVDVPTAAGVGVGRRRVPSGRLPPLVEPWKGRCMDTDLIIRRGTVVDGTGAAARRADVAIAGDRIVAIEERIDAGASREIDAEGRVVTPGFVGVHTHLDAQLAWD